MAVITVSNSFFNFAILSPDLKSPDCPDFFPQLAGEKSDIGDLKLRTNQILEVVLASTLSGSNGCA